mmetsp:Transcript_13743/g.27613  ORF Transcript_13743/g.27613 Transcript_13743/m.27613 type:complete len:244 (-) Transcript_13743:1115-1846(-)
MLFSVSDLFICASSTSRMRRATAESSAVEVVRTTSCRTPVFTVPPETRSLGILRMGRDSPVRELSSTVDWPSTTIPSHGTLSPVFTETREPTGTTSAGTVHSFWVSGSIILAVSERSWTIAERAIRARELARDSSHSDKANKNTTAPASGNSPRARAPMEARNMSPFASKRNCCRSVPIAFLAIGGSPKATEASATYLRYSQLPPMNDNMEMIQRTPESTTVGRGHLSFSDDAPVFSDDADLD